MKTSLFTIIALLALMTETVIATPNSINGVCQPSAGRFHEFEGTYTLRLKIGESDFVDRLTISKVLTEPTNPKPFSKVKIEGEFEVVDNFKSTLQDGSIQYAYWMLTYYLDFKITATENNQTYPVFFSAEGDPCSMTGKAYSPTRETLMGTFSMTKDASTCLCE